MLNQVYVLTFSLLPFYQALHQSYKIQFSYPTSPVFFVVKFTKPIADDTTNIISMKHEEKPR